MVTKPSLPKPVQELVVDGVYATKRNLTLIRTTDTRIAAESAALNKKLEFEEKLTHAKIAADVGVRMVELAGRTKMSKADLAVKIAMTTLTVGTQAFTAYQQQQRLMKESRAAADRRAEEREEQFARSLQAMDRKAALELMVARQRIADAQYPFEAGPGALASNLALAYTPGTLPLLLVMSPAAHDDGDGTRWKGISARAEMELQEYHTRTLLRPVLADRSFTWPNRPLYEGDLAGRPTIVLGSKVTRERLTVWLGGCHLDPAASPPVQDSFDVLKLGYLNAHVWTPELVAHVNATSSLPQIFEIPQPGSDPILLDRLNQETAARAIALCAVAAMDAYYLLTKPGYDEQIDHAVRAAALFGEDWPVDQTLPLWQLTDPAYHLLHRARRYLRSGDEAAAELETCLALNILAGHRTVPLDATTDELAREAVHGSAARHHLRLATAILSELPDTRDAAATLRHALQTMPDQPGIEASRDDDLL